MKVRCLFNKHSDIPELITKYGYFAQSVLHITVGKIYTVYAMTCCAPAPVFRPSLRYTIKDDSVDFGSDGISSYNAMLFEVIDSRLGLCDWHYSFGKNGMDFLVGYDEFVNNYEHYEGVVLSEEADRKKFLQWCDIVDNANKNETD
ncbi:MAG: hypothetical protein LBC74_01330 [Planctomycetaceae bacterium]|jgi:hypothetical protein|nr:hypothetical protein [Planctomycetaceae bacterium]